MFRVERLKTNREALFWTMQVVGWSVFGIAQYLGSLLYYERSIGLIVLIMTVAGFVLSTPLRYLCRALYGRRLPMVVIAALSVSWVIALLWRFITNWAFFYWAEPSGGERGWSEYFSGTLGSVYPLMCWIGFYFAVHYYDSMQTQRQAALRAEALAREAQFKMLRYQLNPHFLFNTLNAISTLILDQRNPVANSAVTGLSEFLRYTLDQDPMKKVTVAQELDALALYLNIEKLRFGHRLTIDTRVDDQVRAALVPSLVLQPLIENCIKYAISPREAGGTVRIIGTLNGSDIELQVSDDGPGPRDLSRVFNGRGVGLRNTRERLQVLYGERANVEVHDLNPGTRVALKFPAEFS